MKSVGVIGLGKHGKVHAERLWKEPEFRVTHVFQRSRREPLLKGVTYSNSVEELCLAVDVVVIATPPHTHFELTTTALASDKHVIVEKPTATSLEETERLLSMAEKKSLAMLTFFSRRWDPDFLIVKKTLSAGFLGEVHTVESRVSDSYDGSGSYPGRSAWKKQPPSGGILWDWSAHLLDHLFELFPEETPEKIFCHTSRPIGATEPGIDEQFIATFKYASRTAVVGATWNATLPLPRWHVSGKAGSLRIEFETQSKGRLRYSEGGQMIDRTVDAESSASNFVSYASKLLEDRSAREKEAKRMLQVSRAMDLCREAARLERIMEWSHAQTHGSRDQ